MPVIRFSHVNLRAPRAMVDALRDFYCEVVGLQCGPRPLSSYGYWLYAGGCEVVHLSESRPGENRGTGALTTFDHAAFSCTDRHAHERVLDARGIAYRTVEHRETGLVQIFFTDPAGNGVELQFLPEAG